MHRPIPEAAHQLIYEDGCLYRNGKRAGSVSGRYRMVGIDKQYLLEHRVIWYLHHGEPGDMMVDHIDGDCFNNRIENLQLVTNQQNQHKSKACNYQPKTINGTYTDYGRSSRRESYRKKQDLHNQTTTGEASDGHHFTRFESADAAAYF